MTSPGAVTVLAQFGTAYYISAPEGVTYYLETPHRKEYSGY